MKKLAILYGAPLDYSYGGIAPFIKNLDKPLNDYFEITYLQLPIWLVKIKFLPQRLSKFLYYILILNKFKKYDFILSHEPEASYVASLSNIPFAHIFHGNHNPMTQSRFIWGKYFAFIFELFKNRIVNFATLKYTVGPEEVGIPKILNPISHNVPQIAHKERNGFIFCGRLEKVKNIDRIIKIYSSLPTDIKKINPLFIAGTGTQFEYLKKIALDLKENVIFLGQLDNLELIKTISSKRILLMASLQEGLPMAIAESFSVGVPVISTDTGDISRVLKHKVNGCLLPIKFDDFLYIESIYDILSNYSYYAKNSFDSSSVFKADSVALNLSNDILSSISGLR